MTPLPRSFYDRDAQVVARDLLGTLMGHRVGDELRVGRVVETEAYLGEHDLAAHSSRGRTKRTEVMFGPPGFAYVYLIYGMHHCINAVTDVEGVASAVLIRALEPVRNLDGATNGPGRLCRAMGIDLACYGHDLVSPDLFFAADPSSVPFSVVARPRVGVDYAGEWVDKLLRFYIEGNRFVSKK